jgi:hypothetical protein
VTSPEDIFRQGISPDSPKTILYPLVAERLPVTYVRPSLWFVLLVT